MTTAPAPLRHAVAVAGAGFVLTALGVLLYVTELSRTVGLALAPLVVCLLGGAVWMYHSQRWPSRRVCLTFLVICALALAYAIGLAIYAALQPALPA